MPAPKGRKKRGFLSPSRPVFSTVNPKALTNPLLSDSIHHLAGEYEKCFVGPLLAKGPQGVKAKRGKKRGSDSTGGPEAGNESHFSAAVFFRFLMTSVSILMVLEVLR